MGVQKYLNGKMGPKNKAAKLEQFWGEVHVLVIEEMSGPSELLVRNEPLSGSLACEPDASRVQTNT